jgi:hypothetical protein
MDLNQIRGDIMTVDSQMKTAIASSKSIEASLTTFSLQTENPQAKQLFSQLAKQQEEITKQLETRYKQILEEEPQWKQD